MTTTILRNSFQRLINRKGTQTKDSHAFVFGRKIGLLTKIFGCRHGNIGRPFTQDKVTYRTCLKCGARRRFNPETLETHGEFYFPLEIK